MNKQLASLLIALPLGLAMAAHGEDFRKSLRLSGQAFTEMARIMRATDTVSMNYDGNLIQGMTGQLTAHADLGERVDASMGFGIYQYYQGQGNDETERIQLGTFRNYVSEARVTAYLGGKSSPTLSFTLGNFRYNYHPSVRNLGLYLLRGSVYPGFLASGFHDHRTDTTRATVWGARLHHRMGNFQHDLLLNEERELPPSFDLSLAYVARYKAFGALEIGGGVNFYRLIPNEPDATTPSPRKFAGLHDPDKALAGTPHHPYQLRYIEVMGPGDTLAYTHAGTKVMAMFNLDLKPLFGAGRMSRDDLVLYGEAAIIGTKDYGSVYSNIFERIPVMGGFNIPTFGLLDRLSLEVEWYGAKYRADYSKLGIYNSNYFRGISPPSGLALPAPSPIPVSYADFGIDSSGVWVDPKTQDTVVVRGTGMDLQNLTKDDWKWSLNFEKTALGRVRFTGQIANDHYIPRPARTGIVEEAGGFREAFTDPMDWYFLFRVGFLF